MTESAARPLRRGDRTNELTLDGESLTTCEVEAVAERQAAVRLAPAALARVAANRLAVDRALEEGVPVYGATAGVGGLGASDAPPSRAEADLIRGTAAGTGQPLPGAAVRAAMVIHLNGMLRGHSGVRPVLVERMASLLNSGLVPFVPSRGSLGASGDLAPSAHAYLPLIGEGSFLGRNGQLRPAPDLLQSHGLEPLQLAPKEAISILNGTHFMAGLGALLVGRVARLLDAADAIAAMTIDGLRGASPAFDARIHALRPIAGQARSAAILRSLLNGSRRIDSRTEHTHDAYSLRCVPQVHGSARHGHGFFEATIACELNAVTDNPIVFEPPLEVISAGNFHGQPLALAFDTLRIALTDLAALSERRTFRLLSPSLGGGLPPFFIGEDNRGLGYMVAQFTCVGLVAEMRVLAQPVSIDTAPTLDNLEDHVSLGMTGGLLTSQVCDLLETVLAIEAMVAAQSLEGGERPGDGVEELRKLVRSQVPPVSPERQPAEDIEAARKMIAASGMSRIVDEFTREGDAGTAPSEV